MVKIEKTKDVVHALKNRYDGGGAYAFMEQVGNATGRDCNRHADAIVVGLWKSRGFSITGFEVKVSRQDWLKELKNPAKADPIAQYCNQWYLVVGDKDIVQFGEIPMNWGLMVPHTKNSLKIVKPAVINEKPKPVDLPFMCAVLRRATEQLTESAKLRSEYSRGYDDGKKYEKENFEDDTNYKQERIDEIKKDIDNFEKAAGFKINERWKKPEDVGHIVKMVLNGTYKNELENLECLHTHALNCAKGIEEEIQKHKEEI